ncbi:MAG: hypothetical protein NO117_06000 [Sulfolobales archaeon]|nr:hypothetical protein [Sulfolobales archaeon]
MEEELVKPGEREMIRTRPYLYDLIERLGSLVEENGDLLEKKGLASKLMVTLELIAMNRLQLDVIYKNYWDRLVQLINELNSIPELKGKLDETNYDVQEINKLKTQGGF